MPELCYSIIQPLRIVVLEISTSTNFPQDAVIGFVQLIPHFGIFVRTYNWNQSLLSHNCKCKIISVRLESWFFWSKMPKFGDASSVFLKTSVKFKISTFEIGYLQNFVKIKKSILFGPKYQNLRILAHNFPKRKSDLKPTPSK